MEEKYNTEILDIEFSTDGGNKVLLGGEIIVTAGFTDGPSISKMTLQVNYNRYVDIQSIEDCSIGDYLVFKRLDYVCIVTLLEVFQKIKVRITRSANDEISFDNQRLEHKHKISKEALDREDNQDEFEDVV